MIKIPTYTDGVLNVLKVKEEQNGDYPVKKFKKTDLNICFREISIFDRIKYEFEQSGIEVTMKIRIPRFKGIRAKDTCLIDEEVHLVYNAAQVLDKNNNPETELTLIRPEEEVEVIE